MVTDDKFEAFRLRLLNRRIPSPSPRKPTMSTHFNPADNIERQLTEDGHRTWGFVIYRTCYGNDEDWTEFLKRLKFQMEDVLDHYNGRDVLDLFALTVIEDPKTLDGATAAEVRERFRQWCVTAPQHEQGDAHSEMKTRAGFSPRYRYAIQVDSESLHSVVHDAIAPPGIDTTKKGWVRLIDGSWGTMGPDRPRKRDYPAWARELWVKEREEEERARLEEEEELEPLEGIRRENVGWVRVPYRLVMEEYYVDLRGLNSFTGSYRRPPAVIGYPYND